MTSESVKLTVTARQQAASASAAPFLTPGHLILFTPGRQLRELVLHKIKSLEHRLILVRHTSVFVVLRRCSSDADSDDWHYISCAGMSGWIFIPADLKESLPSVFRSVPSIHRYQDWKGNNHFLQWKGHAGARSGILLPHKYWRGYLIRGPFTHPRQLPRTRHLSIFIIR
jgi:hypothetical protein